MKPHDIVLVGGGHTHAQVLRDFAINPLPDVRLTLVTDRIQAPYSGMLPGYIAGKYTREEMHIDLERLARMSGARLVHTVASGLDRSSKTLHTACGKAIRYDTLSLNLGITPDLSGISGAKYYGIAVKPISDFLAKLETLLQAAAHMNGPRRFVIIGGGAAGVELAIALRLRLEQIPGVQTPFKISLLASSGIVPTLNACVQRRTRKALQTLGIEVHDSFRAVDVLEHGVRAEDGQLAPADAVLISTAARAPSWLATTDMPLAADGCVKTKQTLTVLDDECIFAVGDCGVIVDAPRPKAGVFAVRQGPSLIRNLRRRVVGKQLVPHRAQQQFLTILMTGDNRAIAGKGGWLCLEGQLLWKWKDRIDRRFMRLFSDLHCQAKLNPIEQ